MNGLSERMKIARGDIPQQKMADLLGIKQSAYGHYETGRSEPSLGTLLKFVEITGRSLDYMLGREHIGDRLKMARKHIDMSVPQMAAKINMTVEYVAGIENGVTPPTEGIIHKCAQVLGVSVEQLKGEKPMRASTENHGQNPAPCPNCERLMGIIESQSRTIENLSICKNPKGKKE